MPYLLPPGDPYEGEIGCMLVAYPKRDEYRRALLGQLAELVDVWNWEGTRQEQALASESWRVALDETLRCAEMAICDELIAGLEAIQAAIYDTACCSNLTPSGETRTTDYSPTNPPTVWGDGNVISGAEDYAEVLCYVAHEYVDDLIRQANQVDQLVTAAGVTVTALAAMLGFLGGATILLAIEYGLASAVVAGLIANATSTTFDNTAANLEGVRDDLVCTIINLNSTALRDVIETAVGVLPWSLFYNWVDYGSAIATIANGGANGSYLDIGRRDDCDCDAEEPATVEFGPDGSPKPMRTWYTLGSGADWDSSGNGRFNRSGEGLIISNSTLSTAVGATVTQINKIMVYCRADTTPPQNTKLQARTSGNSSSGAADVAFPNDGQWYWVTIEGFNPGYNSLRLNGLMSPDAAYIRVNRISIWATTV